MEMIIVLHWDGIYYARLGALEELISIMPEHVVTLALMCASVIVPIIAILLLLFLENRDAGNTPEEPEEKTK